MAKKLLRSEHRSQRGRRCGPCFLASPHEASASTMQFEVNVSQNPGYMRVVGSDLSPANCPYCLQHLARDIGQMMTEFRRVARGAMLVRHPCPSCPPPGHSNEMKPDYALKKKNRDTHNVLVWIHIHPKSILLDFPKYTNCVVHEFIVVLAPGEE